MFAYCLNTPVNYADPYGTSSSDLWPDPFYAWFRDFWEEKVAEQKEKHYSRNELNKTPDDNELMSIVLGQSDEWIAVDDKYNAYHRFTNGTQGEEAKYNKKYQSPDGQYEVIICYDRDYVPVPYIVTDPVNMGTYNYGPGFGIEHLIKDVLPYWIWKNSPGDTTNVWERVFGNW